MKLSIFVDTNVFLDNFLIREPGYEHARQVLLSAERLRLQIYTSSSNVVNLIYFLKKAGFSQADIVDSITDLLSISKMISPTESSLLLAISSGFSDMEDAIQYHTALQVSDMDYFVTNNIRNFKKASASLPAVTAAKMVSLLSSGK